MASLKEGLFDPQLAYQRLYEILAKERKTEEQDVQTYNNIMNFLCAVNNSGYERGFTEGVDINLKETGVSSVEQNTIFDKTNIERCPDGIYKVYWKNGKVSYSSIGTMKNKKRWIAASNVDFEMQKNNPTAELSDAAPQMYSITLIAKI